MTPERWQQVKLAVSQVMQAPPEQRTAAIDAACGNDAELRREVESLVAASRESDADEDETHDALRRAVVAEARLVTTARTANDEESLRAALQANLGNAYDILSTLGVGGMGAVFLARERVLDRYVAIKTLRSEQAVTSSSRERFRREARIAAQLSHPGILPLHAFGEVGGMWYLVMGYVRGQTLAQRLQTEGRLPANDVWRILRALTDALEHAHQRQVIHRDIKPANILIDADSSRTLLADFGISKLLGENETITQAGDLLGTPHFMAPEQITNAPGSDARSDLYSLGAVGYAMLTGRAPLAEMQGTDFLTRRATAVVVPVRELNPSAPLELASVIMRCLATNPAERWQSAHALGEALDRVDQSVDAAVSPAVREVAGFGAYSLAWAGFWFAAMMAMQSIRQRVLLFVVALLVPMGLALHVYRAITPSVRKKQLVQVAFWPPMWWGMWWPVGLRRPGDLWKRLPWPAKGVRVVMSLFTAALPVLAFGGNWLGFANQSGNANALWYSAVGLLVAAAGASLIGSWLWARTLALTSGDVVHLLVGSTAPSAFWRRREIVRVLHFNLPGVRPPDPDLPSDFLRALEDLQRIGGEDAAYAVEEPAAVARKVVSAIGNLHREIASLEKDAPTAEIARVTARLAALQDGTEAAHNAQRIALVELVRNELELLQGIQQRKMLASTECDALFALLRELWAETLRLADSSGTHPNTAARVAELVSQGSRMLGATADVE